MKLVAHDVRIRLRIGPDAAFRIRILRRVSAKDGAECPELDPACVQFWIDRARHMAADIMTPVGIADVRCRCREPGLKGKRVPN